MSNITTFTKLNSISVITDEQYTVILLKKHVYKTELYISNITDENTFTKLNSISVYQ